MNEQQAQPQFKPCPECGGERVQAAANNQMVLTRIPVKGLLSHTSNLLALVCNRCGHTTFYADNPSQFRGQ